MTTVMTPAPEAPTPAPRKRWRMPWVNAFIGLVALVGLGVMLYPTVASWLTQYYQSQAINVVDDVVAEQSPTRLEQELARAREYNDALVGGALLTPDSNVPTSDGTGDGDGGYYDLLNVTSDGIMGRLRIDAIDVDLPIYHGTSEEVLAKAVGHLQGTSLPVGGVSQHSVLTAHRGYPSATLFNNLHKVEIGDRFTVEVFGEVLTYQVIETQTVLPEETQAVLPRYGEDLMTLITCTPLGINSHRELVTGERVTPTPIGDLERAGRTPEIPGFPWWVLAVVGGVVAYGGFVYVSGRAAAKRQ